MTTKAVAVTTAGSKRVLGFPRRVTGLIVLSVAGVLVLALIRHMAMPSVYPLMHQVPWAFLASGCALFAAIFTGLFLLATVGQFAGQSPYAALGNRSAFLSIVTLFAVVAMTAIHLCMGSQGSAGPWAVVIEQITRPDSTSNVWWMKTLYSGAVGSVLIMFGARQTGRYPLALLCGIMGGLAAVGATMSLAAVFVSTSGQSIWYGGGQLGLYFLCSSVMAGASVVIMFTHLSCRLRGKAMKIATRQGIEATGKILAVSLYGLLVVTVWRFITILSGDLELGRSAAHVLLIGPLAVNFWVFEVAVGLAIPLIILGVTRLRSIPAMSLAALLALVGTLFQRYDVLMAGRMMPVHFDWNTLGLSLSYVPSFTYILWVIAGFSLIGAGLLLGEGLFGQEFRSEEV